MFCPKCGKEADSEHTFCPDCGTELQLVPEYEMDEELINGFDDERKKDREPMDDLFDGIEFFENKKKASNTVPAKKALEKGNTGKKKIDKNKMLMAQIIGLSVLIIAAVIALVVLFGHQSRKNSDSYQIDKAQEYMEKKNYSKALEHYKNAYGVKAKPEVIIGIAKCYYELGDKESAALYYLEAAENDSKNEEVFKSLLKIYDELDDKDGIRKLYNIAQTQSIRDLFAGYLSSEPIFSIEEGTYNDLTEVTLSIAEKGDIYYTLDGSAATEESTKYKEPIQLEEGKTVIHAVAKTKTGQLSDEVIKTYEIVLETPKAPGITPDSGKYSESTRIEVAVEEGSTIYYTTDGSVPTEESRTCSGSFPMPIGNNIISVMYVDKNGKTSDVTKKNYNLTLNEEVSEGVALNAIKEAMLQRGEIENLAGYVTGGDGLFIFRALTVEEILGEKYYIIEKYKEFYAGGEKFLSYYAYNITTGKLYNAEMADDDTFKLSAF